MSINVICDGCKGQISLNGIYFSIVVSTSETIFDHEGGELPKIVEGQFCGECIFGCHYKEGAIQKGHIYFSRFVEWRFDDGYDTVTIHKKRVQ